MTTTNTVVHGQCDARFESVAAALAEELDSGEELGASIAVDIDGESMVDIWGGHTDVEKSVQWREDTIVNAFSCTKTVTSLAALILVDRGLLDPFAPVAKYWPEFAANGKGDIEVRHVMSHTSGLSGWQEPVTADDVYNWDKATGLLAAQAPWWPPGTASGYHAATVGFLVGELVRRVTGMSLKEFVRSEIAGPLGADFQIGARPEDDDRVATIVPAPVALDFDFDALDKNGPMFKTLTNPPPDPLQANTVAWRRADLGAANGHGNARSLARMLSPLSLAGQANGVKLLSPATIELIFAEQSRGPDLVLGVPVRWGLGFGLPLPASIPEIPDETIAFWCGWGGSIVLVNPDRRATIAYVMNRMGPGTLPSDRTRRYVTLIYQALG